MPRPTQPAVYDVAIVGGGPAGATAALDLARAGARVVVLERERLPRYKTCGGGLVARALDELPRGTLACAERKLCAVEMGLMDRGLRFRVQREQPVVAMAMRSELDRFLLEAAAGAGAEIRDECEYRGQSAGSNGLDIETGKGQLKAGFLIGADGALSPVARSSGWKSSPQCIPALEAELEVGPDETERFGSVARFDFGLPAAGYGWIFPKREHLSVGILCMRRGSIRLKQQLSEYLSRVGLGAPKPEELHGFVIPVRPRSGGLARGRVLLVGDAAGLADPLTGEGISYAVHSGRLAARAWSGGSGDPERVGRAYQHSLGRTLRELRVGRFLARLIYDCPRLRGFVFEHRGQALCEGVTDVYLGRKTYRGLVANPLNYLKLLARMGPARGAPGART